MGTHEEELMARQAIFVHGNIVLPQFSGGAGAIPSPHTGGSQMDNVNGRPWSDVLGARDPGGVTFRGRPNNRNTFFAPIAIPIWRDGRHAQVARVAVGYSADAGATITLIQAHDGHRLAWQSEAVGLSGPQCDTWDLRTTFFDINPLRTLTKGLGLSFHVSFTADANITFCWVGCELEV